MGFNESFEAAKNFAVNAAQTAVQTPVRLTFDTLEKTVREGNVSIRSYQQTVESAEKTDVSDQYINKYFNLSQQIDAYDKQIRQKAQEDSNAIIEDANTRANQIIFSAQQQSQKLVDDNEITRRAQAYAVETRERAEKDADSIYNQACAQVDKMLSGAAAALSRSASELAALRDSLLTQGSARQQDR